MTGFKVVIPARYASTRLPGKPLAEIAGRAMVLHVLDRARSAGADAVLVATDHPDVEAAVRAAGGEVLLTGRDHASGTDRIAEVVRVLDWADDDIVVNVQGDEPLIDPLLVRRVAEELAADPEASIATASHRISDPAEVFNPNVVKVVCDQRGRALYFSRATIPWARDAFAGESRRVPDDLAIQRHVGLYAYRGGFLRCYADLAPAPIEQYEALEQLRAMWHGYRIRVCEVDQAPPAGVDTPEDLRRVRELFDQAGESG